MIDDEIFDGKIEPSYEDLQRLVPPDSARDSQHLMAELRKGMLSPVHRVTDETWAYIFSEIERRSSV